MSQASYPSDFGPPGSGEAGISPAVKRLMSLIGRGLDPLFERVLGGRGVATISSQEQLLGCVGFTGCGRKQGTTTVVTHAGLYAALEHHLSCLVIDMNFRHPAVAARFQQRDSPGLADCLVGELDPAEAIQPTFSEKLHVIGIGATRLRPDPDLCGRAREMLLTLQDDFQLVLIDLPEFDNRAVTLFGPAVDQRILVADSRRTGPGKIRHAKAFLGKKHIDLHGVFLNHSRTPPGGI